MSFLSENLQPFVESTLGQVVIIALIALLFAAILFTGKAHRNDTKVLVVSAVLVALAIALNQITLFRMPQGGSVTAFSMLPIVVCGYLYGVRRGVLAGVCFGLLNLMFNPYVIHPIQLLLDYPFAFGALGFAGLVANKKNGLIIGYLIGVLSRYFFSVLSGIVFFGAYAPENFNAVTWSVYYNITYMGAEALLTLAVLAVPAVRKSIERVKQGQLPN